MPDGSKSTTVRASLAPVTLALLLAIAACASGRPSTTAPGGSASATSTAPSATLATREWMQPANDVTLAAHSRGGRDGGPAVIVIHGGPGLSHEYTAPIEALATESLRFIGYDQRGVGGSSPAAPNAHRLEEHVADVEVLRLGQGVERVHLLGHSWGGLVAMAYAVAHPDHVASLVLVDSLPPSRAQMSDANERFDAREKALIAQGLVPAISPLPNGADCSRALLARLPVYYADPHHPATKTLGGSTCRTGILQITLMNVGNWDLRPSLATLGAVAADTLVVEGAADPFGTETAAQIVEAMGGKPKKVIFDACGHLPWEECPGAFFAEVRAFYASHAR